MTLDLTTLDAHEQPDEELKATWKRYSRTEHEDFISHPDIDELDTTKDDGPFKLAGHVPSERLISSLKQLEGVDWDEKQTFQDAPIYYHPLLPGATPFDPLDMNPLTRHRPTHISFHRTPKHTKDTPIPHDP